MPKFKRVFNLLNGKKEVQSPKNFISESGNEATIYIYDEIDDWWGINAKDFADELKVLASVQTIHLRINCPGGDIFQARAMQQTMAEHPATFIAHIDGMAASAASFFIRGADKRIISDGGFIMIHKAMSGIYGTGKELVSWGEALKKMDNTLCESYVKVTGLEKEHIENWMDNETWFDSAEALEHGFVDEIVEAAPVENVFDLTGYKNVPVDVVKVHVEPEVEFKFDTQAIARQISLAEACI